MQIAVTCASPPTPQGGGDGSPRRSFENRAIGWASRKVRVVAAAEHTRTPSRVECALDASLCVVHASHDAA
jgi:hypothetical protein